MVWCAYLSAAQPFFGFGERNERWSPPMASASWPERSTGGGASGGLVLLLGITSCTHTPSVLPNFCLSLSPSSPLPPPSPSGTARAYQSGSPRLQPGRSS